MEDIAALFLLAFWIPLLLCLLLVGPVLTVCSVLRLTRKFPRLENADCLALSVGSILTALLYRIWSAPDWNEPLIQGADGAQYHAPLASWRLSAILALAVLALAGYLLLRVRHGQLPPLPLALSVAAVEIGMVLSALVLLQLGKNLLSCLFFPLDIFLMTLLPFNYILCAVPLLRTVAGEQARRFQAAEDARISLLPTWCGKLLARSLSWYILGFVLALPLLALALILLVLLGQTPDAAVRAFTETADWTFSQQIPPPPVEYDGHYLCTAAAGGHPKVVKPLRTGSRLGHTILVNRQLCAANAFEQLLSERAPRVHRALRSFYNRRGYPLSQKITTPLRADMVYWLMKPPEWFFVLVLYTFDQNPESRIARQYPPLGCKEALS